MIEKVGHIRNPLSVIAIFAALAEVSGTLILPHLEADVQQIYVWFLMLFPVVLVVLFFATLNFNAVSLYAPSDYKNEGIFEKLFVRAQPGARIQQLDEEVETEAMGESGEDAAEAPSVSKATSETTQAEAAHSTAAVASVSAAQRSSRKVLERALLAEELAIAEISRSMPGMIFERNLATASDRQTIFDAVSIGPDQAVIVEVKFTRVGKFIRQTLERPFQRVQSIHGSLPEAVRKNLLFIFAVVVDGEAVATSESIRQRIHRLAQDYPFLTRVEIFHMDRLQAEFQQKN
jgi:hypothetical protein